MLKFIVGAAKNLQEGAGCCALFATYYIRKAGRVTRKVGVGGRSRAGLAPPLRGGGFLIALFSRWVAMHGRLQRAAYMPPLRTNPLYSLKYKVAGGVADFVCCGTPLLLSAAQFAGNRGRRGLLFTAQFAAVGLLSAAQFGGCYSRHSLVLRRGGCYSRHNSKPLLFTAHFRFLRKKSGCYRRHNCVWGCYSRHNSAGLLNTAQLPPPAA